MNANMPNAADSLRSLLDDPAVENVIVTGCDRVVVELADGSLVEAEPVADSDEELLAALVRAFGDEGRRIAETAADYAKPFGTEAFAQKVEISYGKAIEDHRG